MNLTLNSWLNANLTQAAALVATLKGLDAGVVELSLNRYQFGCEGHHSRAGIEVSQA
jgi:hypothetical protein